MTQHDWAMEGDVCGRPVRVPIARARSGDPETSHEAAFHMEQTGKAGQQRIKAAAAVLANPGSTAMELAARIARTPLERQLTYRMLGRRLPELRDAGLVRNGPEGRTCSIIGSKALTWHPL